MAHSDLNLHSLDDVIGALYRAISGPAGGQDFELERLIHHKDARMVRTRLDENGKPVAFSFGLEGFIANVKEVLKGRPFYEIEIARKVVRFGNIAQVFSAYEAKEAPDSKDVIKRGMNMIHVFDDGKRWWVMHVIWDDEREGVKLPPREFFDAGET
jgi:hypothetical protein